MTQLGGFDAMVIGCFTLIALLALTAVFSTKPHRREAAVDVLRILVPAAVAMSDVPEPSGQRAPDEGFSPNP